MKRPKLYIEGGVIDRIALCTSITGFVAAGFCLYVVILYTIRGSEPFHDLGTTVGAAIGMYLVAALISGVTLGVLLPIGRTTLGAMVLGVVAVFPLYKGAGFVMAGYDPWSWSDTVDALVLSVVIGSILGWWAHSKLIG